MEDITKINPPIKEGSNAIEDNSMDEFFDKTIHDIKTDKILLKNKSANQERIDFYNAVKESKKDLIEWAKIGQNLLSQNDLREILVYYLGLLEEFRQEYLKLALILRGTKILVWAEIGEDDSNAEESLYIAEAKANAKFRLTNFRIDTTIVENCDKIDVPTHYILFHPSEE